MSESVLSVTYDQQKIVEQDKAGVGKYTLPASGKVMKSDLEIELNIPKGVPGVPKLSSRKYAVGKVDDVDYVVQPIVENVEGYIEGGTQYGEPEAIAVSDILGSTVKNISQNGRADVTAYRYADVDVPNTYTDSDEGKIVSGGTLVEQEDLDAVDFGDDPTVDTYGKTASRHYEAIADAINAAKARPNAVTLESLIVTENGVQTAPAGVAWNEVEVDVPTPIPVTGNLQELVTSNGMNIFIPSNYGYEYFNNVEISVDVPLSELLEPSYAGQVVVEDLPTGKMNLQVQTEQTVTENGTYDTTTVSSVTVNVQSFDYKRHSFSQSGLSESDLLAALGNGTLQDWWFFLNESCAALYLRLTLETLGIDNTGPVVSSGTDQDHVLMATGMIVDTDTTPPGSMGACLTIGLDGNGEPEFRAAYLMQNGQLTDISPYLGQCTFAIRGNIFIGPGD